jgi:pimeloyl-ACP methyl ester carboxylesterase
VVTASPVEVRYARSGEVHIAYQVVGDGPFDLVFSPSPVSNLEVAWEWPPFARFLRRLASFSRLILFDKRGTGLSDRVTDAATLEERMDDVRAVMDAAGSERAALFGSSEGGPMALLFAATYPDRVSSLVLYGSYAKSINTEDYSSGVDADLFEMGMTLMEQEWGNCALIDVFSPSVRADDEFRRWWGRYERQSASPGAAVAIQRLNARLDVRPILTAIQVPTLVIYRAGEFVAHVQGSRYLAEHVPGARFVELEGVDYHPYVGDQDAILDPIEEFLTGTKPTATPRRMLAAVVLVDTAADERALDIVRRSVDAHLGDVRSLTDRRSVAAVFDGPDRAVRCASAIRDELRAAGYEARCAGHIGELEHRDDVILGGAVDVARDVLGATRPGQVLISRTLADLVPGSGLNLLDVGAHALSSGRVRWHLYAVNESARPVAAARREGVFVRDGDVWVVGLDGADVRVRDMKGLADIAVLLDRPGVEVHVAELVGADRMPSPGSAQARLDARAIMELRRRLADLADDETEAEAAGDSERASRARSERDAIVEQVSADVGLGGRSRPTDDWVERARKAVRTRVAAALKRIEDLHPSLGRHLRASIRTGVFCAYEPVEPIDWRR